MDTEKHRSKIREQGKRDPRERVLLILMAVAFLSILAFGALA